MDVWELSEVVFCLRKVYFLLEVEAKKVLLEAKKSVFETRKMFLKQKKKLTCCLKRSDKPRSCPKMAMEKAGGSAEFVYL